jgi:ribonucleoside-diphosphate reductase alpha chain
MVTIRMDSAARVGNQDRSARARLPNRRASENFDLEVGGLKYTASFSRFPDGELGELFLNNQKSNSAAGTNARDATIACSFALQHGADFEAIRRALSRDAYGRALSPLGVALDIIAGDRR